MSKNNNHFNILKTVETVIVEVPLFSNICLKVCIFVIKQLEVPFL